MALLLQLTQKLSQGFSALWARYPNKSAKKDAEKAYGQVVKTPEIDDQVHQALDWQIPHWETMDWYHPPYLATYLRQRRFEDEPPAPKKASPPPATLRLHTDPYDQARRTNEAMRLMKEEGLSREEAIQRAFK